MPLSKISNKILSKVLGKAPPKPARYQELIENFPTLEKMQSVFPPSTHPRILLPIGVSGSGKSSALSAAEKHGWAIINADECRRRHLQSLLMTKTPIVLNGVSKIPDPNLAADVFAPELRKILPTWILEDLDLKLREGRNLVLDITNLTLERARYLIHARAKNYECIAILFPSLDLSINATRVKGRGERGGLDIVDPLDPQADQKRIEILNHLDENFWGYLSSLQKISKKHPISPPLISEQEINQLDFSAMKAHKGNLESFIAEQPSNAQLILQKLAQHDLFDEVFVVPAPAKSEAKK